MMKWMLCILIIFSSMAIHAQEVAQEVELNTQQLAIENVKWVNYLYEQGVRVEADTLFLSVEVRNVMAHDALRSFLFPEKYEWASALYLMEQMDLKKAFWFLINLYPDHKELVVETVLKYNQLFKMEKALIASFYTYAMVDPMVMHLEDGKPIVDRPDLVEQKLGYLKEIIRFVQQ